MWYLGQNTPKFGGAINVQSLTETLILSKTGRAQGFSTEQSLIKTLIEETLALETKKNLYSWIKVERVAYRNT